MANAASTDQAGPVWGPITPGNLMALSVNAVSCGGRPFLIVSVGRDSKSWGISIAGGEQAAPKRQQPIVLLKDARWRQEMPDLESVALVAMGGLRAVIEERGWGVI